jgi:arylamine N-acetyltransferase
MSYRLLSKSLLEEVLDYLGCPIHAPSLRYLNRLIHAYIRKVPWESVSRIVKCQTTVKMENRPRYPEEFWQAAIQDGFGGTCFESGLAFYSLLTELGYEGYLTVNDMGTARACHAAIVVWLHGQKYLVDITIPLHCAVRFDAQKSTRRRITFHSYEIRPTRENFYEVIRSSHPRRIVFTLVDLPVSLQEYHTILESDYTENGLFLNRVVMVKVIDDRTHRFFSDQKPYKLERFSRAGKTEMFLKPEILAYCLATVFEMPEDKISSALTWIQNLPIEPASQSIQPASFLNASPQ